MFYFTSNIIHLNRWNGTATYLPLLLFLYYIRYYYVRILPLRSGGRAETHRFNPNEVKVDVRSFLIQWSNWLLLHKSSFSLNNCCISNHKMRLNASNNNIQRIANLSFTHQKFFFIIDYCFNYYIRRIEAFISDIKIEQAIENLFFKRLLHSSNKRSIVKKNNPPLRRSSSLYL